MKSTNCLTNATTNGTIKLPLMKLPRLKRCGITQQFIKKEGRGVARTGLIFVYIKYKIRYYRISINQYTINEHRIDLTFNIYLLLFISLFKRNQFRKLEEL